MAVIVLIVRVPMVVIVDKRILRFGKTWVKAVHVNVRDHDCGRRENENVPIRRSANSNERGVAYVRGGALP